MATALADCFHSQIAREEGRFTVAEVIREIHDKMIRRILMFSVRRARKIPPRC